MKKVILTALALAVVSLAQSANAQSASANFAANARVVTPISIAKTADMNFGDVVPGGSAGTVILSTAGARSTTGGVNLGNANGAAAAAFTVSGQGSSTYAITLPASANITSGGNNMSVGSFTSNPSGTGILSAGGSQALALGATLDVGASQATGTYTGNFSVSVNYN